MVYTNEERIDRIWDRENCTQLLNRHAIYYSNEQRRRELDELWVQEPENQATASLAYNNGYYVGMDAIAQHYVVDREQQLYDRLKPYTEADPGLRLSRENLSLGASAMHTSTTPLVYISDDGKTARFQGYQLGYQSIGRPDGTAESYLEFGLVYADLIREEKGWKIWHLVLEHDHTVEVGHAYAETPVLRPDAEDPICLMDNGTPTIQRTVYDPFYGWEYIWDDMPRPYTTYQEGESYGPNGNLGKPYYERQRR